jgi:transposase
MRSHTRLPTPASKETPSPRPPESKPGGPPLLLVGAPHRLARPAAARHRPSGRHPASRRRRAGAVDVVRAYPFLLKLFADAAYQGPQFAQAVAKHLPELAVQIVKRSDKADGFEVLPMRWVVERTLAWLSRCRRLAKDFENLTDNALAFLRLASVRIVLRRLCNPS